MPCVRAARSAETRPAAVPHARVVVRFTPDGHVRPRAARAAAPASARYFGALRRGALAGRRAAGRRAATAALERRIVRCIFSSIDLYAHSTMHYLCVCVRSQRGVAAGTRSRHPSLTTLHGVTRSKAATSEASVRRDGPALRVPSSDHKSTAPTYDAPIALSHHMRTRSRPASMAPALTTRRHSTAFASSRTSCCQWASRSPCSGRPPPSLDRASAPP